MARKLSTDVLIIGAGPAGALIADTLARQGVDVVLVERSTTQERSFRGETVAALSVAIMRDLGYGPALKTAGYLPLRGISFREKGKRILAADYGRFPIRQLPIDMPQPALLGVAIEAAKSALNFNFMNSTSFVSLIEEDGIVRGAEVRTRTGDRLHIHARLTIGADGRFSKVRRASGLEAKLTPMERDFVWFKLPRPEGWEHVSQLVVKEDRHLVILPTFPNLLRVGYNVPKDGFIEQRKRGIESFQQGVIDLDPRLAGLVERHVTDWSDVSFLEIFTAEMEEWARDGLLLIGDAAHTVTPVLGQGVNLAIQDAVCFAPVIARALGVGDGPVSAASLRPVIERRRKHKALITRFQRTQEASLAQRTRFGTALRRLRLSVMHRSPFKYALLDRVMNAPHDLRDSPEYRSMIAALIPISNPALAPAEEEVLYDRAL